MFQMHSETKTKHHEQGALPLSTEIIIQDSWGRNRVVAIKEQESQQQDEGVARACQE
jgi:hypothetical protein